MADEKLVLVRKGCDASWKELTVDVPVAGTPVTLTAERVLSNKFSLYPVSGQDPVFLMVAGSKVVIPARGLHFSEIDRHFNLKTFSVDATTSGNDVAVVYRSTGAVPPS